MPLRRVVGSIHPIAVFDILEVEVEDHHGINIPQLKFLAERYLHEWFLGVIAEQDQRTTRRIAGVDGKVHRIPNHRRSERIRPAGTQLETLIFVGRKYINSLHKTIALL